MGVQASCFLAPALAFWITLVTRKEVLGDFGDCISRKRWEKYGSAWRKSSLHGVVGSHNATVCAGYRQGYQAGAHLAVHVAPSPSFATELP